jgi:hypothetical protein
MVLAEKGDAVLAGDGGVTLTHQGKELAMRVVCHHQRPVCPVCLDDCRALPEPRGTDRGACLDLFGQSGHFYRSTYKYSHEMTDH